MLYADEYFHAWAIATHIEEIAKAGRAVYDLPVYVNNALRTPVKNGEQPAPWKSDFAGGGPTYDVIGIYKAVAPHIDFVGPDIYMPKSDKVRANLRLFQRSDNALIVPEMGNAPAYARYVYEILGKGAIGVAPFGLDYASYSNYPLGAKYTDKRMVEPFAQIYKAFEPMQRAWAGWAFNGLTYGIAEGDDRAPQVIEMKGWNATLSFREFQFGEHDRLRNRDEFPPGTEQPTGGVAIAQVAPDEFVFVGQQIRIKLAGAGSNADKPSMYARVEEGRFDGSGKWEMERNWNGDQTDHGLNLPASPTVLRVRMGTY